MDRSDLNYGGESESSPADPSAEAPSNPFVTPPVLSVPKGGGAIRGMGEKFNVNPVTGTGGLTVPLLTTAGRADFGPKLTLSYDSGSGNGAFGLGWSLSLPSLTRKTDKGLPLYRDEAESDVFLLSGSEDLVPVPAPPNVPPRIVDGRSYRIRRYRPRIEGLFARIERWTNERDPSDSFWRSISRSNVTTWYGKSENSRIVDPADPARIFSWLICESYDDKGNAAVYEYKEEDSAGVDLSQVHEGHRDGKSRAANRYLKRIFYGNWVPYYPRLLPDQPPTPLPGDWHFQLVLDYGDHDPANPSPLDAGTWQCRPDPFSSYRSGFEVRTYRLCQRTLMFHHFPNEPAVGSNCLVRSHDFVYSTQSPVFSFLNSVTQTAYRRTAAGYDKQSLPPLEMEYTKAQIDEQVRVLDSESLKNLPEGLDGKRYQWVDLDGEGLSGVLAEQSGAWYYKRNVSPLRSVVENGVSRVVAGFGVLEKVFEKPSLAAVGEEFQFLDLAGDGRLDWVSFSGPAPGFYERNIDTGWDPFVPFETLPVVDWQDPRLKFIDLTGDGRADILITEDRAFRWYPSRAEAGFEPAFAAAPLQDEGRAPRTVFADEIESILVADMSGDGLADLVRIRNGDVCYWPNLGYGKFGAKVTMDRPPDFDTPDQFDPRRLILADIDGSGLADIIYLAADGARLYFNQSGNAWSEARLIPGFPVADKNSTVSAPDLLGNGTACLLCSSPLPGVLGRSWTYVDLMGGQKPHLLAASRNNLGMETRVAYSPSTKFYLDDKVAGRPWITKLPFPVHVVERTEILDLISRNRFVTRYAYHHGYFDGYEREFRGFGMVEQWDTEEFGVFSDGNTFPQASNVHAASHVPPALTKTWFHTGAYLEEGEMSLVYAREYFGAPQQDGPDDPAAFGVFLKTLLPDTVLPAGLSAEEEREACRALKGSLLRQEVYSEDGGEKSALPYTVSERNYTVRREQARGEGRHGVFFVHSRESLDFQYERSVANPRVSHALTFEVDRFGNTLKSAVAGYGRRSPDAGLPEASDRTKQSQTWVTYAENAFTTNRDSQDVYRAPLPCESRNFELTGYVPADGVRFSLEDFVAWTGNVPQLVYDGELRYEQSPTGGRERRLIDSIRTYYRPDDLGAALGNPLALLPLGQAGNLSLPGESYQLAFTPGLLSAIYRRILPGRPAENLLPNPVPILQEGGFVDLDGDGHGWVPSGRIFYHPDPNQERAYAPAHFYRPRRFRNPFGTEARVRYDTYDLMMLETEDALQNKVSAGLRAANGAVTPKNDYRLMQAALLTDPNGAVSEVAFDTMGFVVATALRKGTTGDDIQNAVTDLSQAQIDAFFADPRGQAAGLLGDATTRTVYDWGRFYRSADPDRPPYVATLARETHASAPAPAGGLKVQVSLAFSDGFGREIQKKIEAEAGPLTPGGPDAPRWVGNGWTVFNNKGLPVKQYEPFFTASSDFEFGRQVGISATMFYDPLGRTVGTIHPNHSYEKILYEAWRQETWDVNDTVLRPDPENDPNIGPFLRRLDPAEYLPTWYEMRAAGDLGDEEQDAAEKAEVHDSTPSIAHLDALGRTFLTIAQNRFLRNGAPVNERHPTRVDLDILGNQRVLFDSQRDPVSSPLGRSVIRYDYNLLNMSIHQLSMEAGERWTLPDVTGEPIRNWDGLGRTFRTEYDALRRMSRSFSRGADPRSPNREILLERVIYGEAANTGLTTSQVIAANLRGKPYLYYDGAGLITSDLYDFKGNRLRQRRKLARDYKGVLDWSANPVMENREYITTTEYDALNRWTQLTHPDRSVLRPAYNEANLLTSVTVRVRGSPNSNSVVSEIRYDAKGQREWVRFGSGMETRYFYDPDTLRLTGLQTLRNPGPEILQDLRYTYDPAGNITFIRDRAQQTVFFRNRRVEPSNDYTYDALYRLIEARGREHLGQAGGAFFPVPPDAGDAFHSNRPLPGDGNAMGTYREQYRYDLGGNLAEIKHVLLDPAHPGWVRSFVCQELSLLDGNQRSNRLTSSRMTPSGQNPVTESFSYDRHGNMSRVPHLSLLQWNHRDQLAATARQVVTAGTTETTYYVYDAGGTRLRKVTERQASAGAVPRRLREWIFLDGFDIEREYGGNGQTIVAERETVTVMDDKKNVALLETQTVAAGAAVANPATSTRYPVGNHLGSAALELDRQGRLLSYEEYYPYGGTSYQGVAAGTGAFRKRFRYTGRERDVESGFYYHGARYYAPWLGRWISCDPLGIVDGNNLYAYALADPIAGMDPSGTQVQSGVRLNPEAYSGSLLAPETEEEPPPAEAEPAPEPSPDFTWETYANLPEEYRFPFYTFGVYDSPVDLTTAYHYSKVKQALDTLFSGSVVVSPEDRVFAVPEALWHELSYLAAGTFYMSEHVVGSVFELVGQGYAAMENLIPGFNMTMESLMGVPFLGPEVGALRMAAQASRFSFAMKLQKLLTARAINSAPMHRIYFGLTAQEVAALGKTGHVLHVEHLDSALEFWVHSGAGGPIGHTEYGAALFLRELGLLEKGQSFLLRGIWAPCQRGASNCSALLDYLSKAKGVNFMYLYSGDALVPGARTASGGIPVRGVSWFEGGRGRFLKSQGAFSGGAKYPTHIVNDFK